ncbi:OprD family outer membrane porin, partial [Pseudomonas aeruginosa]
MKVMKWSAIALAVSAGSTQFAVADAFVSDQAEAKGFIEDSSLDLLLRNYYFNRDGKEGRGDRVDWTQGNPEKDFLIWQNPRTPIAEL